jgi:hypothetical protein
MPSGIIMASSSVGATQEAIEKVLTANGHEPEKPEVVAPVEPKREDFKTDEEFETAQETFEAAQEEAEENEEETAEQKAERERLAALPRKSRRQKAIEKATRQLQEDNRRLADRLAALEGKGGNTEKKETPAAAAPKVPKREDFKTDAEFDDAMFDYRYQQRRAKEESENQKRSLDQKLQENFTDYKASVLEFKEEHEDWDAVVDQKLAVPDPVYYAIVDLGKEGPPVTYYLGQHPEELDRLAQLTPYRAAIEVGRLADKLKSGKAPEPGAGGAPPKKTPPKKIPEPVKPVSTSATASSLTSREAAKNGDFKAFKAAQARGA